jgi:hypothetical protein
LSNLINHPPYGECPDGYIWVFGSNEAGRHGKGTARIALLKYGAKYGQAFGRQGMSFAIPTKDSLLFPLNLGRIACYVADFLQYAIQHPDLRFYVTPVGTGLAKFRDDQIAPLFKGAPDNCLFCPKWEKWIK